MTTDTPEAIAKDFSKLVKGSASEVKIIEVELSRRIRSLCVGVMIAAIGSTRTPPQLRKDDNDNHRLKEAARDQVREGCT